MTANRLRKCRLAVPAVAVAAFLLGGCAGYTLGDSGQLPFRSVYVAPPVNTSLAPQVAALVGAGISREIDRSGRVSLGGPGSAEAELRVTIVDLTREISADRADDTGLARKWRVTLTADVTLVDPRSGLAHFEGRPVSAFDEVYADSGHVAAEYQNMPVLAARLAEAIVREVLGVW